MIKFNDIKYERVLYDETSILITNLLEKLTSCNDFDKYIGIVRKINDIQNHIEEMNDYADIRNMRDSSDEFYMNEINYWNSMKVKFDSLFLPFYAELKGSKFREQLENYLPSNFFKVIEYQIRTTSDDIASLVKQENDLKMDYRNLNKSKIVFDGDERTIGYISGFFSNKDRDVRKRAHDSINDFYYSKQSEYDNILFNLVSIRNKIAKKLGFNNYVEYSLYKLKRIGYDYSDIKKFRDNVINYINPICKMMSDWQKEELGLSELKYYDTIFFSVMPQLKFVGEELLDELKGSFTNVDSDLSMLFNNMVDNGYIDLVQRDNKVNFSITNYLNESCIPVITGNYKNNYLDVQTTTHEMGHSFQKYCASIKDKEYIVSPLLKYPTMEVAEMFSYSMELIMMNYISNLFDEDDYKKYCFMKIYNLLCNLPYICLVDEFQEIIYSNVDLKVEDIRSVWLDLVKKYHLEKSNSGHINLDEGGFFYRQSHIYLDPFYYIDYALSYFGAFSIWNESDKNLNIFKEVGSVASYYSFKDLIEKYNMPNPFDEKVVCDVSNKLKKELELKRVVK